MLLISETQKHNEEFKTKSFESLSYHNWWNFIAIPHQEREFYNAAGK